MVVRELRLDEYEPVMEAHESLRVIREVMERSTRHSTFNGLSGILAGLIAITGCFVQSRIVSQLPASDWNRGFLLNWSVVVFLALAVDFLLTKRKAAAVGKMVRSRLGKQMLKGAGPGLASGALLTLVLLRTGHVEMIYPIWMLSYGTAVCSVGLFSQREVTRLGICFLGAGTVTLLLQTLISNTEFAEKAALGMTGLAFGGIHIAYGIIMARKGGW